jgi:hypothetical protein
MLAPERHDVAVAHTGSLDLNQDLRVGDGGHWHIDDLGFAYPWKLQSLDDAPLL